jgi:hypothetical protein
MHNRNISQAILKEFWKKIIEIWLFFQERKTLVSRYNNTYVFRNKEYDLHQNFVFSL